MVHDGEPLDNGILETYTLAVGQADARVTITPGGQTVLTDTDKKQVAETLETVFDGRDVERSPDGKIRIDHCLVTHIDADHTDGLEWLADNYEVQQVIQPDDTRFNIFSSEGDGSNKGVAERVMLDYKRNLDRLNVDTILQVSEGDEISVDEDTDINVLAPPATDETVDVTRAATGAEVNFKPINSNENGAVYKLEGNQSALFMGDVQDDSHHHAESWLMQQHDDPESDVDLNADVAFIGHHGSDNATSEEYLERVDPDIAVISSDFAKEYNHPHDAVLKNLYEHDVDIYWTAGHGTIRTDLDDALTTDHTNDLDTTNAADLAALKHYCKDTDTPAEEVELLAADELSEETPDWVAETAPMVMETTQDLVDTAITNADDVEDVRQTLDNHPSASDHLREIVQTDRADHVPSEAELAQNKREYQAAKRAHWEVQQPTPWYKRAQTQVSVWLGRTEPQDEPLPDLDAIGPREHSDAVRWDKTAGAHRRDTGLPAPASLTAAEETADRATAEAENAGELCWGLRETPGAHNDFHQSVEIPHAHDKEKAFADRRERMQQNQQTVSPDLSRDKDQGMGLGL